MSATTHLDQPARSTSRTARPLTEEERARLEAERDFLLRSLEDLETERAAGELSADRYRALAEHYVARGAKVLRALERPVAEPARGDAQAARPRWRRWPVVAAPLAAVAVVAALVLPSALDRRTPGQTITGNAQSTTGPRVEELARVVEAAPDDVPTRLAFARALLDAGELLEAVQQYDDVARRDPANAEARAYGGWIVFLAGLTDPALERVDAAVAADPSYPDAHFFRGMILLRGKGDEAAAVGELQQFLELAPPGSVDPSLRQQVEAILADLEQSDTTPTSAPGR